MAELHIEEFCHDSAGILLTLYQQFPRKIAVFVEDIAGPDEPDEYGVHSKRHLSCLGTLIWLAEEGYLRYESLIRQEAADQVVLTERGFLLMTRRVALQEGASCHPPERQAEQIRQTLLEASSSQLAALMLNLFHQDGALR